MNRDHPKCDCWRFDRQVCDVCQGVTGPERDTSACRCDCVNCVTGHCDGCYYSTHAKEGDSTPPAAPVEPPDENWFQRQARLAARDVQLLPPWLRSHPPAVSGEGEIEERADAWLKRSVLAKLAPEDSYPTAVERAVYRVLNSSTGESRQQRIALAAERAQHQQEIEKRDGDFEAVLAAVDAERNDWRDEVAQRDETIRQQVEQIARLSAQVEQMARKADDTAAYEAWQIALAENATLRAERDRWHEVAKWWAGNICAAHDEVYDVHKRNGQLRAERDAALRTLMEQWRAFVAELRAQAKACEETEDWELKQALQAEANRLESCADALDAILKETTP